MPARRASEVVPAAKPLRLVLEVTADREPIEGSLVSAPDAPRAFTGLVELIAALESALERHSARSEGRDHEEGKADACSS